MNFFVKKKEFSLIDKLVLIFVSLIPLCLTISIFIADLLASLTGLLILFTLKKENIEIYKKIKLFIIFFIFFYVIILISFIFSDYKSKSFLPSFFYFRYFLLSLSIYYLLSKFDYLKKIFFFVVLITFSIIVIDSLLQFFLGFNLFGYQSINFESPDHLTYLTSFFNEEKKLGSYVVRFLPLILSLIYLQKKKIHPILELFIILILVFLIYNSSERVALFLSFFILISYFFISNYKKIFLILLIPFIIFLVNSDNNLKNKYFNFTLQQIGFEQVAEKKDYIRYYSKEHEDLTFTGWIIFKNNFLFGSGVKTNYDECNNLKKQLPDIRTKRNNELVCSTHAHNTFIQILSEIGIFGFIMIFVLYIKCAFTYLKLIFKKNKDDIIRSYFFINLSILVNIFPFIPSGSFFNNWMSVVIFYSLGFWLYLSNYKEKI
jgi:O-antigen ligase